MKGAIKLAGLFLGSLIVVVQLALLAVLYKPDVFRFVGGMSIRSAPMVGSPSDSTIISPAGTASVDSIRQLILLVKQAHAIQEAQADSIRDLTAALETERKKVQNLLDTVGLSASPEDSSRIAVRQTLADFLGSMNAGEAARILRSMDDNEAREVLLRVKRRQAGKILSSLDPAEAVRIMR